MKTTFNQPADVPHIRFTDAEVTERRELRRGLTVKLDAEGLIVGFELN